MKEELQNLLLNYFFRQSEWNGCWLEFKSFVFSLTFLVIWPIPKKVVSLFLQQIFIDCWLTIVDYLWYDYFRFENFKLPNLDRDNKIHFFFFFNVSDVFWKLYIFDNLDKLYIRCQCQISTERFGFWNKLRSFLIGQNFWLYFIFTKKSALVLGQ